jgi:hypothetical protein
MDVACCRQLSSRTAALIETDYSEERFIRDFGQAVARILALKQAQDS